LGRGRPVLGGKQGVSILTFARNIDELNKQWPLR
jgi:hypothetical protein